MSIALLLGPTGLVGSHLLHQLVDAPEYTRVIALSRRPLDLKHEKLTVVISELKDVERHRDELQANDIFCCLGTTIKAAQTKDAFRAVDHDAPLAVARLQEDRLHKIFIVVSGLGAAPDSMFFYSRVKAEMEQDLAGLDFRHVFAVRPSLLLGQRRQLRPGEILGEIGALPFIPLMRGSWRRYRPIQAGTVADNMLRIARGQSVREGMEWAKL